MYNQIKLLLISVFTLLVSQKIKPYVDGKVTDALTQAANTAQQKADAAKDAAQTFATNADAALLLTVNQNIQTAVAAAANDIDKIVSKKLTLYAGAHDGSITPMTFSLNDYTDLDWANVATDEKVVINYYDTGLAGLLQNGVVASKRIQMNFFDIDGSTNLADVMLSQHTSITIKKGSFGQPVYVSHRNSNYFEDLLALKTLAWNQVEGVIADLQMTNTNLGELQTAHDSLNTNFSNFLLQYQEFQTDYAAKQQSQDDAIAAVNLRFDDYLTAAQVNSLISEAQTEIMSEVGTILGV